jgi:1,6-anhydro-N-acetylmuramate kinase
MERGLNSVMTVIGLMSGTSLEGIDVALVATDGERRLERWQSLTFPYAPKQRGRLRDAMATALRIFGGEGGEAPSDRPFVAEVEQELTGLHAEAVRAFLETYALSRDAVSLIGYQGVAIYRDGARRLVYELGDPERLAQLTGIDVVYDFAAADVEAGGQGRPLDPVYHRALAEAAGIARPLVVVETGARTTVTYIGEDGSLMAFDAGPSASAETILGLAEQLPAKPLIWLLAGGNTALLATFSNQLGEPLHRAEEMGWSKDHFEVETFAYLAVRSLRKLPLSFPGTTGVKQPMTGGRLARAPRR